MKKWLIAFSATALLLAACGRQNKTEENYIEFINVNKGIVNVDVTLPVSFFIASTEEEIIAEAKEEARRIMERAHVEAELEKSKVADEVKKEMISIASVLAGKVVAANINTDIQTKLIDETLKEMGEGTWLS